MPESMQSSFHLVRLARDVMESNLATVPASVPLHALAPRIAQLDHSHFFLIEKGGKLLGVIESNPAVRFLAQHANGTSTGDIALTQYEVVSEQTTVSELLTRMRARPIRFFLVAAAPESASARDVKGIISKERMTDLMTESLALFAE
jgi:CBS domain-containing protein